jgi:hypothetical protein
MLNENIKAEPKEVSNEETKSAQPKQLSIVVPKKTQKSKA